MSAPAPGDDTRVRTGTDPAFGPQGWGDYRRLWASSAVSALGDGMRLTALPLLAVSYTTDPQLLSLVTVAGTLPLLASPLAGIAADRWNRKRLLVTVDLFRFVLIGLLGLAVLADLVGLVLICAVALLLGVCEVFFVVTAQSFLPQVVRKDRMTAAYGRQHAAQLVCRDSVGQPVGGLLFAVGMALPFVLDAASFLGGVLLLLAVRPAAIPRTAAPGATPGWGAMIKDGYRYLRGERLLLTLAGMLGTINFFVAGMSAVLVLYVLDRLGLRPGAYGFFLAAGALGGVLGGTLAARARTRFGLFPAALAGLVLTGASAFLLGVTATPVFAGAAFLLMTFGAVIYQTLTVSFRQTAVPPEVLGRVNGVYRLFGTGTAPLGALLAGFVADRFGVRTPFLLAGASLLLLVALAWRPVTGMAAAQERREQEEERRESGTEVDG
ncbi:MFS transporter [Streptomyces sp. NPDC056069]|uniref:MFS transporter n=1 Tax=Streptomyces sp. NPDC056069 TaxID=3345702 RepID=UPI0035DEFC78